MHIFAKSLALERVAEKENLLLGATRRKKFTRFSPKLKNTKTTKFSFKLKIGLPLKNAHRSFSESIT
jgi:hypothetical protein